MDRPVFVGDVQGCAEELADVIARAEAELGADFTLWCVGDVVNRGPDSLGALRLVREHVDAGRGEFVLGNHEIHLLRVAAGQREPGPYDSIADVLDAPDADDWIEWLRRRPLAVQGRIGARRFAMVHASVHPEWSLAQLLARAGAAAARLGCEDRRAAERFLAGDARADADLDALQRITACRSTAPDASWSSSVPEAAGAGFAPWHRHWGSQGHDYGVVYGHWALQGLHVAPGLRGLDTGCVHHGRGHDGHLTAWVPPPDAADAFALPDTAFWQVRARRAYYARRDAAQKTQPRVDSD